MDFEKLKVLEGKFWDVFLHQDQTSIGRVYFWYKGSEDDLLDISKDALIELHDTGNKIKSALDHAFHPDLYNYLSLNNNTRHLHVHMIPRYSRTVDFSGKVFEDTSFGGSYKANPDLNPGGETLIGIKELIKKNL